MATAIHQRGLQRYAGGGFISSLFGASKPETATEKFARQDAEFKAKHPERFQAPASTTPAATAPGDGGVKALIGGSLANSMKEREKAAGLKAGGMVRKKCVEGGDIKGPGGPTDDLVPIDASNGEFMIKASSAKILGPEVLEALNDLGDEPKDPKMDAAEDAREKGMKCGGAVRKKMADGGPVEMPMNTTPMTEQDQQAFGALQSTATGVAPAIPAPTTTAQAAQQPPKQLRASTTAALNSYTPLPIPQLKAGGMVRQPKRMAGGGWTQDNQAELDKRVAQIPAGGTAPAPDGLSMGNDFTRNVSNSAMALPGVGGALAGGAALAAAVPAVARGLSAAAPMAAKGLGMAKTVAPYAAPAAGLAALQAESGSDQAPQVTAKPAAVGATPTPGAPVAPSLSQVARQQRQGDPSSPDLKDEFSNAMIENRNPGGMVRKVVGPDGRTSYSGSNVSGDVSFQGADGNALPGRPGGGSMTYGGMSPEAIKSALTNPDGSAWSAGDNAIMAANLRDGVDKYRGTSRDPRNDPMNQPMTKDQRAARVQMAEIASRDKQNTQANAMEQEKLGMSRKEFDAKMAKEKQATDLQNAYMNAKTPEEKESYRQKMVALGLLKGQEDEYAYAPGGQMVVDNQLVTQPGVIFNKRTGQQQGGPQRAQPAALPPKDKLVKGQTYPTPRGNAVWDGQQFTPV